MSTRILITLVVMACASWQGVQAADADLDKQIQESKAESVEKTDKSVDGTDKDLARQFSKELHELHHSLGLLRKNAKDLLGEYSRSESRLLEYGDFIEDYIDDKPVPSRESLYPYGMGNFGNTALVQGPPLPPRKEWVSHFMSSIDSLTKLTGEELNDILKLTSKPSAKPIADQCTALMTDLQSHLKELDDLTSQEKSDRKLVQQTINKISDDAQLLQINTKKLARVK